jgi:hypothetical protein
VDPVLLERQQHPEYLVDLVLQLILENLVDLESLVDPEHLEILGILGNLVDLENPL